VCQFLDIIILCPKIYLDYFLCIKYQYIYIYIKIEKEKGKRKDISSASWAGGVDFGPAERDHMGRRPTWPVSGGGGGTGTAWAHVPEGGGG
jgi:hypothetical protein